MPSGSSGGGTNYQSQQSSSGPPAFLQPYLQGGIADLAATYQNQNKTAPQYYSGETVAPLSGVTQQAVSAAQNQYQNNPTLSAANTQLTNTLNGNYLDPSNNPAYQGAVQAAVQPLTQQFLDQTIPQITSQFAGAGGTGSGIQNQLTNDATTAYSTGVNNAAYTAANNYYQNARNNQLQAAGLTPQINQAGLSNVSALGAAGNTIDQQRQAQDTSNQAAYNYNSNAQMNYISQYLSMLNGGYPGGETTSSGQSQSYQPTNAFGSILGGGMGLLGLGLQAAPLLGFSDYRLKEDISAPIGTTHEGIPIRLWKYRGDPTPRVGFVAQEVALTKPEAVVEHPSGYLMVDHGKAAGLF